MEYENQIYGSLCASAFIIILPLIVQLALPKFFPSEPAALGMSMAKFSKLYVINATLPVKQSESSAYELGPLVCRRFRVSNIFFFHDEIRER